MKKFIIIVSALMLLSGISAGAFSSDDVFYMVSTGQLQEFKNLKNEVFDINARDRYGRTLLIAAIYGIIDFQHKNAGTTALHSAAAIGDFNTVEMLLKSGADYSVFDESGYTPYTLALKNSNTACAELLLKYAKAGKSRAVENSVSSYIEMNYIPIIADLLNKKIDVNVKDFSGNAALHYAVQTGMTGIVRMLSDNGANINLLSDQTGKSPLIYSSERGFTEITQFLLSRDADVNVAYTVKGNTGSTDQRIDSRNDYYEVPQKYNLIVTIRSENRANPDRDNRCYYKVYIDKVEAGRTSVGLESQNKVFTASVDANKHLLRVEKYDLDESQGKYIQVNNIYQPEPDFIYFEAFNDKILQIDVVHTARNIKSKYEMNFVRKGGN